VRTSAKAEARQLAVEVDAIRARQELPELDGGGGVCRFTR
jgi:hypothetical protein